MARSIAIGQIATKRTGDWSICEPRTSTVGDVVDVVAEYGAQSGQSVRAFGK